jgi:hypothetical protein
MNYAVASWCGWRFPSFHWSRHCRHNVLHSVFSISIRPNKEVRRWKAVIYNWLTFSNFYRSISLIRVLLNYTLTTGLLTRYVAASYTKSQYDEVHVSVLATLYVAVVCFRVSISVFSWLMAALFAGTVSGHAIKHGLHCHLCGTWEEYVASFSSVIPYWENLNSLRELHASGVRAERLSLFASV